MVSGGAASPYALSVSPTRKGLHELDPAFRRVTLENQAMKAVVRDLQVHHDPVGKHACFPLARQLTSSL